MPDYIAQTQQWILTLVIGENFCPFAAKVFHQQQIHYKVETSLDMAEQLQSVMYELIRLEEDETIETSFLIFPHAFATFADFQDFTDFANQLLEESEYDGVYQIADFHPLYCFDGEPEDDAANYTNRSIYPMLHFLREESIDQALANFPNPESIPDRNIAFARSKGLAYMQLLRASCC